MSPAVDIARSGLSAAMLRLDSVAHNIANAQTPGFRRQQVVQQAQSSGGVAANTTRAGQVGTDLATELVEQMQALYAFKANLQVIKVQDRMIGSLLDTQA